MDVLWLSTIDFDVSSFKVHFQSTYSVWCNNYTTINQALVHVQIHLMWPAERVCSDSWPQKKLKQIQKICPWAKLLYLPIYTMYTSMVHGLMVMWLWSEVMNREWIKELKKWESLARMIKIQVIMSLNRCIIMVFHITNSVQYYTLLNCKYVP